MGKIIICSARRAKEPYYFHDTGVLVYSIEELCYYISHYLYFINSDTIKAPLFEWIGKELGLTDRSSRLLELEKSGGDIKTMITVILCSCDYFTEEEVKSLLYKFDGMFHLPPIKRECMRAKNYMLEQNYKNAEDIYLDLLRSKEAIQITAKEYGEIIHNLTVAKIHLYGLSEAYEGFMEGYLRSGNEESLRQYILALIFLGKEEKLNEVALQYGLANDIIEDQIQMLVHAKEEAREHFTEGQKLRNYKSDGKIAEFYGCADNLIKDWAQEYRKGKV